MLALLGLIVVPLLILYVVRRLDVSEPRPGPSAGFLDWLRAVKLWQVAVTVALSALVFAFATSHRPEDDLYLTLLVLSGLLLIARAWRHEFLFLMALRDDELPGRRDKLVWIALMFLLPPVGLWTFRAFRESRWPESAPALAPESAPGSAQAKPGPEPWV